MSETGPCRVRGLLVVLSVAVCVLAGVTEALAQQSFEVVGERALGMGGAFVAVANDPSAVFWNPAGLVAGGPAAMTIGWSRSQSGNRDVPPSAGPTDGNNGFTSLATWPLGISWGRFTSSALEADPVNGVQVRTLQTRQYGATLLQTVARGLVVGTTLKYVRGSVSTTPADGATVEEAFKNASHDASSKGAFDLDVGVMADMEKVRVGFTWKNLTAPSFVDVNGVAMTLERQPRIGVAVLPTDGLTFALDLDLDTVDLRDDPRRMIAIGGESRLGGRLAVRSGVRWDLEGERNTIGTAGMSVALRTSFWLDGHYAQGRSKEDREFGVALRAGF